MNNWDIQSWAQLPGPNLSGLLTAMSPSLLINVHYIWLYFIMEFPYLSGWGRGGRQSWPSPTQHYKIYDPPLNQGLNGMTLLFSLRINNSKQTYRLWSMKEQREHNICKGESMHQNAISHLINKVWQPIAQSPREGKAPCRQVATVMDLPDG